MARSAKMLSSNAEYTRMRSARFWVFSCLINLRLSPAPSRSAVTTNCGWHSATLLRASDTLPASPHTIMSGCEFRYALIPQRSSGCSSNTRIRIFAGCSATLSEQRKAESGRPPASDPGPPTSTFVFIGVYPWLDLLQLQSPMYGSGVPRGALMLGLGLG